MPQSTNTNYLKITKNLPFDTEDFLFIYNLIQLTFFDICSMIKGTDKGARVYNDYKL